MLLGLPHAYHYLYSNGYKLIIALYDILHSQAGRPYTFKNVGLRPECDKVSQYQRMLALTCA